MLAIINFYKGNSLVYLAYWLTVIYDDRGKKQSWFLSPFTEYIGLFFLNMGSVYVFLHKFFCKRSSIYLVVT